MTNETISAPKIQSTITSSCVNLSFAFESLLIVVTDRRSTAVTGTSCVSKISIPTNERQIFFFFHSLRLYNILI